MKKVIFLIFLIPLTLKAQYDDRDDWNASIEINSLSEITYNGISWIRINATINTSGYLNHKWICFAYFVNHGKLVDNLESQYGSVTFATKELYPQYENCIFNNVNVDVPLSSLKRSVRNGEIKLGCYLAIHPDIDCVLESPCSDLYYFIFNNTSTTNHSNNPSTQNAPTQPIRARRLPNISVTFYSQEPVVKNEWCFKFNMLGNVERHDFTYGKYSGKRAGSDSYSYGTYYIEENPSDSKRPFVYVRWNNGKEETYKLNTSGTYAKISKIGGHVTFIERR